MGSDAKIERNMKRKAHYAVQANPNKWRVFGVRKSLAALIVCCGSSRLFGLQFFSFGESSKNRIATELCRQKAWRAEPFHNLTVTTRPGLPLASFIHFHSH